MADDLAAFVADGTRCLRGTGLGLTPRPMEVSFRRTDIGFRSGQIADDKSRRVGVPPECQTRMSQYRNPWVRAGVF